MEMDFDIPRPPIDVVTATNVDPPTSMDTTMVPPFSF